VPCATGALCAAGCAHACVLQAAGLRSAERARLNWRRATRPPLRVVLVRRRRHRMQGMGAAYAPCAKHGRRAGLRAALEPALGAQRTTRRVCVRRGQVASSRPVSAASALSAAPTTADASREREADVSEADALDYVVEDDADNVRRYERRPCAYLRFRGVPSFACCTDSSAASSRSWAERIERVARVWGTLGALRAPDGIGHHSPSHHSACRAMPIRSTSRRARRWSSARRPPPERGAAVSTRNFLTDWGGRGDTESTMT
jgi:hypothetical protein